MMKGILVTITADGRLTTQPLDATPGLDALQAGLNGGYLEVVPYFSKYGEQTCVAFCDEDGKNKGLPYNPTADALWKKQVGFHFPDHLVGPIVIVCGDKALLEAL